jgi:GT2 family glycosyltransferase
MTDMRVEIVIPFYGDRTPLEKCLESIRVSAPAITPFVVDSNPPRKRMYFTEAVNHGVRMAMGAGAEVIWVLNADTEIDPETIPNALKCFEEEPGCGLVGTRCVLMSDPDRIFWGGSKQCYPAGKHKSGSVSAGDLDKRTEEEWITFASVFVKRSVFAEIGLLDKTLQHVCSDADFCFRARAAGWKCFYEPTSVVKHVVGSSHHTQDPLLQQVIHRDMVRFKEKWISGGLFRKLTVYDPRKPGGVA